MENEWRLIKTRMTTFIKGNINKHSVWALFIYLLLFKSLNKNSYLKTFYNTEWLNEINYILSLGYRDALLIKLSNIPKIRLNLIKINP